jgi:alpha-amylase/alpha-mannosidase (GH57 family)
MAPNKRFVCIHGHFYQPPRENPWLETVETQDTAAPYHDWNERICAECYATNGAARIVNSKNQIKRIVNNYARISFNFGPTLLSWLKENAPRVYRTILSGERRSRKRFGGHSSAMAQVYNHIIMPLASRRFAGALPTTVATTARSRKACGFPRLRRTPNLWRCWPSTASCLLFWRRTSANASGH